MGSPKRHVAIPKCLLERFSINGHVWVYDFSLNKIFPSSCSKTGAETNYYSIDAEELLNKYESKLASLLRDVEKLKRHNEITNYLNQCHKTLIDFFNFQFQRSKKILKETNKNSKYSKQHGDLSHSELIQIAGQIGDKVNILTTLKGAVFALHIICDDNQFFVTNSLGFYAVTDNKAIRYYVLPISNKMAIVIQTNYDKNNPISHYTLNKELNEYFNKSCIGTEKDIGNGLIIAHSELELRDVLSENEITPINWFWDCINKVGKFLPK